MPTSFYIHRFIHRLHMVLSVRAVFAGVAAMIALMPCVSGCGDAPRTTTPAARPGPDTSGSIVVLGGAVNEVVYALGAGERVVGNDITCIYPPATARLPKVGYQRTISAEQVLSLNPVLVLASQDAGPPAALEQLRGAGVRVEVISGGHSLDAVCTAVANVARILGKERAGALLADSIRAAYQRLQPPNAHGPRVMYVHARGAGGMHAAGGGTAADAMIRVAGGTNAVQGFDGYQPLSAESGRGLEPDMILISSATLRQFGGVDGLIRMPGIAGTPAAERRAVIPIDEQFVLGFGPRLASARAMLIRAFFPGNHQ